MHLRTNRVQEGWAFNASIPPAISGEDPSRSMQRCTKGEGYGVAEIISIDTRPRGFGMDLAEHLLRNLSP